MAAITKTPAVISSEILLKSTDYIGYFILLEGDFDQRFWTSRFKVQNMRPINCVGKPNVLGTLELLISKNQAQRIMALSDQDYDNVLSRILRFPQLIYSDQNDLEVTLMRCPSSGLSTSMDAILRESVDDNKLQTFESNVGYSVVEHLRRMAASYGVLRLINEQLQSGVNFDHLPIRHNNYLNHTTLQPISTALKSAFVDAVNGAGKVQLNLVGLIDKIELHQTNSLFLGWELVQGHDLMQLLATAINSSVLRHEAGHRQASEESLARDLCLMINRNDLQTTGMFQSLLMEGERVGLEFFK